MAINLTYRQIVDDFQAACDAHLSIASFDSGTIDHLDASGQNRLFPFVYLRPLLASQGGNTRTLTFELYALDQPTTATQSNIDVISNTEMYIYDIMAWFNRGTQQQTYEVILNNSAPVNEAFGDRLYGWVGNINVVTPFVLDYCNYPQI